MTDDKLKVIEEIQKKFGEMSILQLGESPIVKVDVIPTGSLALDRALGVGGIPRGRVTEVYGPEASGKTTLCQHVIANGQKMGLHCAFIDMEHALDLSYAEVTGVDVKKLYLSQPDTGEQALEILEMLVRSGDFGIVAVDSVAALVPTAELQGDMGDAVMGSQARLMSQAMRKLTGAVKKSNTAVIFTNQLRMKIGLVFGNPEVTTGGNALKFYAAVRLDMRKREAIKVGSEIVGNHVRVRVVKNKVSRPFTEAEFDIYYAEGISKLSDLIDVAASLGVIEKKASFYNFNDERVGHGKEASLKYLEAHPEIATVIEDRVREQFGSAPLPMMSEEVEETGF
jgi:recombination protein RecA